MLTDEYLQLSNELKKGIRHMIDGRRKICYENLHIYGCEFAPKTFLPWLINRLRESGKPSSEVEVWFWGICCHGVLEWMLLFRCFWKNTPVVLLFRWDWNMMIRSSMVNLTWLQFRRLHTRHVPCATPCKKRWLIWPRNAIRQRRCGTESRQSTICLYTPQCLRPENLLNGSEASYLQVIQRRSGRSWASCPSFGGSSGKKEIAASLMKKSSPLIG